MKVFFFFFSFLELSQQHCPIKILHLLFSFTKNISLSENSRQNEKSHQVKTKRVFPLQFEK